MAKVRARKFSRDLPSSSTEQRARTLGDRVKALRVMRGMSIRELAAKAGVSLGLVSQLERNAANPSVKTLQKIRFALDVSFAQLFAPDGADHPGDPPYVQRYADRPLLEYEEQFTKEILSPSGESTLEFMILNIPPDSGWDRTPLSYAAEKAGLVLEGTLVLCVDGVETTLVEGDSFQFDGMRPHSLQNKSRQLCRTLWIISQSSPRPPI